MVGLASLFFRQIRMGRKRERRNHLAQQRLDGWNLPLKSGSF